MKGGTGVSLEVQKIVRVVLIVVVRRGYMREVVLVMLFTRV